MTVLNLPRAPRDVDMSGLRKGKVLAWQKQNGGLHNADP
jgi:hypothetical protein